MKIVMYNKQKMCVLLGACLLLFTISCKKEKETVEKKEYNLIYTNFYKENLQSTAAYLDSINLSKSIDQKQEYYKLSKKYFKLIEPMISFWNRENVKTLNSPNLLRISEEDATDIKIKNPIGFQVIEENLFSEEVDTIALKSVVDVTRNKFLLIANNTKLKVKKHHLLWIIRDQIVRVATTGLSNFDSPVLGQSLVESSYSYDGVTEVITIAKDYFDNKELFKEFVKEIEASQQDLKHEFESFDRFGFIQNHTHKQLELLNQIREDWEVDFPFELFLSNNFNSLFDGKMFTLSHFSDVRSDTTNYTAKIALGKKLFNDKRLSINNDMSCASCHISSKAFTDGRKTFSENVIRNTPTLTYSSLQKAFFHEARSGSLEGQIVSVINNRHEFNSSLEHVINVVETTPEYSVAFDSLYKRGGASDDMNIRHAIASYVRSLNKFNSKFDNNINGKENTLTVSEKKGFNLFMGKAACATCHFPPVFNGTVPPNFTETELEILGVPDRKVWENAVLDDDLGRYEMFKTEERKGAFKTPTIRNIELTAPYMHNGVYDNLEEVMKFYNNGGGQGIGIELEHQTLPFDSLELSQEEIDDIIAFMKTLTDSQETF